MGTADERSRKRSLLCLAVVAALLSIFASLPGLDDVVADRSPPMAAFTQPFVAGREIMPSRGTQNTMRRLPQPLRSVGPDVNFDIGVLKARYRMMRRAPYVDPKVLTKFNIMNKEGIKETYKMYKGWS